MGIMADFFGVLCIVSTVLAIVLLVISFVGVIIIRRAGGVLTVHQRTIFVALAAIGVALLLSSMLAGGG